MFMHGKDLASPPVAEKSDGHRRTASQTPRPPSRREVNRYDDTVFVMIVFVPCWLVPIGIKPFAIAVIWAENSSARSRTMTLRISRRLIPLPRIKAHLDFK
jgi:hypothetical protein